MRARRIGAVTLVRKDSVGTELILAVQKYGAGGVLSCISARRRVGRGEGQGRKSGSESSLYGRDPTAALRAE